MGLSILRLKGMAAIPVLKALLSGEIMGPKEIAIEVDKAPQTIRNAVVVLHQLQFIERVEYGKYKISEAGRKHMEYLARLSQDQTLGEDKP